MALVDSQKHHHHHHSHAQLERPDWFNCDLRPCMILQDVSAEIVETCQSLGGHLESVCRRACKQLPTEVEAESCLSFLAAFGVLSSALLSVAIDLESTVTKPLERTIRTLEEESNGRLKHWQQVRSRFAELQDRYGKSRQRSLEARDRLASSSTSGIFFKSSKTAAKAAASEQHAAMCELAKCEEELLKSEASLRALEEESRKRIDQLELEKNAFLQGVMAKGTGTLRRLLPIAAKVPPEDAATVLPSPEEWQGVLPPSGGAAKEQWGQEDVRALVAATDAAEAASAEMFGRLPSERSGADEAALGTSAVPSLGASVPPAVSAPVANSTGVAATLATAAVSAAVATAAAVAAQLAEPEAKLQKKDVEDVLAQQQELQQQQPEDKSQLAAEAVDVQTFQGIVLKNDEEDKADPSTDAQEPRQDPSLKYLQEQGSRPAGEAYTEIDDGSDGDSEPETLLSRAAHWTPQVKSSGTQSATHKKSLVFQSATPISFSKPASSSGGPKLVSSLGQAPSASAAGSAPFTLGRLSSFGEEPGSSPTASCGGGTGTLLQRVNQTVNKAIGPTRGAQPPATSPTSSAPAGEPERPTSAQEEAPGSNAAAVKPPQAAASPTVAAASPSSSFLATPSQRPGQALLQASPSTSVAALAATKQLPQRKKPQDDSDSDGELSRSGTLKRLPVVPLENADFDFGLSPVVAEDPRSDFEKYILRLDEHQLGSTEADWDRLQAKAKEHLQGAHVGKLELWWIHGPGVHTTPEAADGLVCFQFVQGCSSNFARVLHLSVVGDGAGGSTWQEMLPSAIYEVRRLILGTLPVDSIRAIVTSVVDDQGKLYVDAHVENAYEQCRFRWFQLTQSLRRTKSSGLIIQKRKTLTSRFLVLNTYRTSADPAAPRREVKRLAPLLLRDDNAEGAATSGMLDATSSDAAHEQQAASAGFTSF